MKHNVLKLLVVLVCALSLCFFAFIACNSKEDGVLMVPNNLNISDYVLTWDSVDGAQSYIVDINGSELQVAENRLDILMLISESKNPSLLSKENVAKVMALGDLKNSFDSEWSNEIRYNAQIVSGINYKSTNNNTECEIIAVDKDDVQGVIIIPEELKGKTITKVMTKGFSDCNYLTDVVFLGETIQIESGAFKNCSNLKRVILPALLSKIDNETFSGCVSLTSIDIPDTVIQIKQHTFKDCTQLTKLKLSASLSDVANSAFVGCNNLKTLTVDASNPTFKSDGNCIIRKPDDALIMGCSNSIIPNGVKSIKSRAFNECNGLTKIDIPNGVASIENNAFYKCTNLNEVNYPATLQEITTKQIASSPHIKTLTVDANNPTFKSDGNCIIRKSDNALILGCSKSIIPNDVKSICSYAFYECVGLTKIDIPSGVTSIENHAFYKCTNLNAINYPATIQELAPQHLFSASNLKTITVDKSNTTFKSDGNCIIRKSDNALILGCMGSVIPNGVKSISTYAFAFSNIEKVNIPSSVEIIESNAFDSCFYLSDVTIQNGVRIISKKAFSECFNLKHIYIPESVTRIESLAFFDCSVSAVLLGKPIVDEDAFGDFMFNRSESHTVYTAQNYSAKMVSNRKFVCSCEFAYDGDIPYVNYFVLIKYNQQSAENNTATTSGYIVPPYRPGYVFVGWSLDKEGTNIVSRVYSSSHETSPYNYTLTASEILQIENGVTLYAVWDKKGNTPC